MDLSKLSGSGSTIESRYRPMFARPSRDNAFRQASQFSSVPLLVYLHASAAAAMCVRPCVPSISLSCEVTYLSAMDSCDRELQI